MSPTGKRLLAVLLIAVGLLGLGMSLCGGVFAGFTAFDLAFGTPSGDTRAWGPTLIVFGLISLALGGGTLAGAVLAWRRFLRRPH